MSFLPICAFELVWVYVRLDGKYKRVNFLKISIVDVVMLNEMNYI